MYPEEICEKFNSTACEPPEIQVRKQYQSHINAKPICQSSEGIRPQYIYHRNGSKNHTNYILNHLSSISDAAKGVGLWTMRQLIQK
jgi:hypothetical protein